MDASDPKVLELAFRLLPAAQELARGLGMGGQPEAELVTAVSERLKEVTNGLSPELEFIAAVNWLGRTLAINRLDQTPLPRCHPGSEELKIPDLLSVTFVNGRPFPCLVEVKRNWKGKIVWTEKYLTSACAYAEKLNLPLLIAWKRGHIWTLTDSRHFKKKVAAYHLDWKQALTENLMSSVFGDLMVMLTQRICFYMDAEIATEKSLPQPPNLIQPGQHTMTIKGAGFLLDGNPIKLSGELSWLLMCSPMGNSVVVTGEKNIRVTYTPEPDTTFSLTDFALMLLLWSEADEPDWDQVVRKAIPLSSEGVRAALEDGLKIGVVQYLLHQAPVTIPDFFPREPKTL